MSEENNPEYDNSVRHLLVQMMQQLYPDIAAYQNNELLYEPPVVENVPPQTPPETVSTPTGYQVDITTVTDNERVKQNQLVSLEPLVDASGIQSAPADDKEYIELVQPQFEFFVEEEEPLEEPEGVPEDGVFITTTDFNTNDPHSLYIENNSGEFAIAFYIENGTAKQICEFKTLEVMLVQRNLTYDDVRLASDADFERYGLTPAGTIGNGKATSLSSIWGLQIRFDSGYKPVSPFVRDPWDYYDTNAVNDLGTPYDQLVYSTQTEKESLREKFEGNPITLDIYFDSNETNSDGSINANFGNPTGTNVGDLRMMILGYWKFVDSANVLAKYNLLNDIGAVVPGDRASAIINLYKAGALHNFERVYKEDGQTFTKDDPIPGWNDFPHIAGANVLDMNEYNEYLNNSNNGKPFDVEYMQPYEPAGSVKYYSAGSTQQLAAEAFENVEVLGDQLQDQYNLDALYTQVKADLKTLKQDIESDLAEVNNNTFIDTDGIKDQMSEFKDDLITMFYCGPPGVGIPASDKFRFAALDSGNVYISDTNVFQTARNLNIGQMQEIDRQLAAHMNQEASYWLGPEVPFTLFNHDVWQNLADAGREPSSLIEMLSDDERLQRAISQYPSGETYNSGQIWGRLSERPDKYGTPSTLSAPPSNLDMAIETILDVATTERDVQFSDKGVLEEILVRVNECIAHGDDKEKHRYTSQVQDLFDGSGQGTNEHNYTDLKAEYDQWVANIQQLPNTSDILYHTRRAFTLLAYQYISVYRSTMRDLGYDIIWSNKSITAIRKYIPEWNLGTATDQYFVQNIMEGSNSVAYAEMMQKYYQSVQQIQTIYYDIGVLFGVYAIENTTDRYYSVQYNIVSGPLVNSVSQPDYWNNLNTFTLGWNFAWESTNPNVGSEDIIEFLGGPA